ncbi:MAG: hypothetical protein WKI04_19030 [Ferruginibacter sp.]
MPGLKKIKQHIILTLLLLPASFLISRAQQHADADVAGLLKTYHSQNFQEKIFVHTSKSFYVCGENIWFKIYNVDAYGNRPVAISMVSYVELLSRDHKPLLQSNIELNGGSGSGSFMLPFSLGSGVYVLRAYTNWMKNFSPELFFETPLTIINSLKKLPPVEKDSFAYRIRFFPEGGNLVIGLQSKVAFQAVGRDGLGIRCSGIIVNKHNDSVSSFKSQRFGIGNFKFTPLKDETYKAVTTMETGETIISDLPPALSDGYVMHVCPVNKENIKVLVFSGESSTDAISLVVHSRLQSNKPETKITAKGITEFIINIKDLAEGVSHFTIFNSLGQPVCERLYFQAPIEKLAIGLTTDQQEYATRKKVGIEISLGDIDGLPANADLSLSVFRIDSLEGLPLNDIQSYLWLGSELKGTIESPSYYFNSMDSTAQEAADNLMLVHGWSRIKWEDVLSQGKAPFKFLPEYEGPVISGRIRERNSGAPAKGIETFLTVPAQKFLFKSCTSDQKGQILFNLNKFYGNNEVIVQAFDKLKGVYNIDIFTPFATDFSSRRYPSLKLPGKWQDQLLSYSVETQVENVYVQDKSQTFYLPGVKDTTAFYSTPDKTYRLDDYTRFITMEEVMREYVTEVRVRKQQESFTYQVMNAASKFFFDNNPLVLLDGLPVFDMNKIIDFNPLKIKSVEVVTKKYFSGNNAFEGIVSYRTYKGDLDGFPLEPGALVLEYPGVQLQREFYSPQYETPEQVESRTPDFRNLLFWAPVIKPDANGNSRLAFFTSDRPGRYAVVVQGINDKGMAGSNTAFFTIHK